MFFSDLKMEFQDCTLVISYSNSTTEGYAQFEVMHADAGRISIMSDDILVEIFTKKVTV